MIRFFAALLILLVVCGGAWSRNSGMLTGGNGPTGSPPPPPPPTNICSNPAVPHPAQAVGFTTLAYCADFTQQTAINNVVYGAGVSGGAQITNWTATTGGNLNWLDCVTPRNGPIAGKQWYNYEVAVGGSQPNPCSTKTVSVDSVSGVNALQMTVSPSDGLVALGITTGVDPCSTATNPCYEVFPTTNLLTEINWRIDLTEWSNNIVDFGNVINDWWSWYATTTNNFGCIEIDFIEYFKTAPVGPGYAVGCSPGTVGGGAVSFTLDSSYHTISTLESANRTNFGSGCVYRDGVEVMSGNQCATSSGGNSAIYQQQGYMELSQYAGHVNVVRAPVHLWVAWIRIWSCAGWNTTGNPQTTSNTCSVASPPTTPP